METEIDYWMEEPPELEGDVALCGGVLPKTFGDFLVSSLRLKRASPVQWTGLVIGSASDLA